MSLVLFLLGYCFFICKFSHPAGSDMSGLHLLTGARQRWEQVHPLPEDGSRQWGEGASRRFQSLIFPTHIAPCHHIVNVCDLLLESLFLFLCLHVGWQGSAVPGSVLWEWLWRAAEREKSHRILQTSCPSRQQAGQEPGDASQRCKS